MNRSPSSHFAALAPVLLCLACAGAGLDLEPSPDARDASFVGAKADGPCVEPGSDRAAGVLALVNDPAVSTDELDRPVNDGGAGLHRTAAENIVAARPFATLAELDAVPYVGPATCRALALHACESAGLCGPSLEVMSWNIESFPLSNATIERVAAAIVDSGADVIGIQEIADPDAFYQLLDLLPGFSGELATPGFYTGVGAIFREDRVVPLEVESLFTEDGWSFPRPPLRLRVDAGEQELTFIVVHLKAQADAKSEARRRSACALLEQWVASRDGEQIIALGDWNDRLTDGPPSNVFQVFLDKPELYRFLTGPLAEAGAFSYVPFESLIDHVLVTDEVVDAYRTAAAEVVRLDQLSDSYLEEVSDHLPILATFSPR